MGFAVQAPYTAARVDATWPGVGAEGHHAISEIDRSIIELDRSDDAAPLKVTMLPSVASHWLIPRLPRIRRRHPNLDVQVIADPRLLDLRAERIDLAIRFCRTPHPGYAATRLMGDRVFPVCAPDLLRQLGRRHHRWLLALPLLHDSRRTGRQRQRLAGLARPSRQARCRLPRRPAVQRGQYADQCGCARARCRIGPRQPRRRPDASGALVCPLELVAPTAYTYYLLGLAEAGERPRSPCSATCWSRKPPRPRRSCLSLGVAAPRLVGDFTPWPNEAFRSIHYSATASPEPPISAGNPSASAVHRAWEGQSRRNRRAPAARTADPEWSPRRRPPSATVVAGHQMAAAEPTELTVAHLRLVVGRDVLMALGHLYRLWRPQGEGVHRTGGPGPARSAVAVAHGIGLSSYLDLDGAAEASALVRTAHDRPPSLRLSARPTRTCRRA